MGWERSRIFLGGRRTVEGTGRVRWEGEGIGGRKEGNGWVTSLDKKTGRINAFMSRAGGRGIS